MALRHNDNSKGNIISSGKKGINSHNAAKRINPIICSIFSSIKFSSSLSKIISDIPWK